MASLADQQQRPPSFCLSQRSALHHGAQNERARPVELTAALPLNSHERRSAELERTRESELTLRSSATHMRPFLFVAALCAPSALYPLPLPLRVMSGFFPPSLSDVTWHGWSPATFHGAVEMFGQVIREEVEIEQAAAATVPSSARNMLPCMQSDADSTFAVLSFLTPRDISRLAASCSAWKRWIHAPHAHTKRALLAQAHAFPAVVASWIRPYIDELRLGALPAPAPSPAARLCYLFARPFLGLGLLSVMSRPFALIALHHADQRWHPAQETLTSARTERRTMELTHQALALLPQLPALRSLIVQLACIGIVPQALHSCFSALAPRLEVLSVMIVQNNEYGFALMHQLLGAVAQLKSLRSLSFTALLPFDARSLPFDALPLLPRLDHLEMDVSEQLWVCTARQLDCLCACRSLTSLSCGSFGPTVDEEGNNIYDGQSDEDEQATVHGLERLIASKSVGSSSAAAAASSSSAASVSSSASAPAPWRHVNLKMTRELTPALWTALQSTASSLEVLEPCTWSRALTAEDWSALSRFTSLRRIILAADLDPTRFMPGLLSVCPTLRRLELDQIALRSGDLAAILSAAPLLSDLVCSVMPLEFSALATAGPALKSLQLGRLIDDDRSHYIQVRPLLPPMPHLTHLLLCDHDDTRLTIEQAEPLNAAILERCPKLSPDNFMQNLWE